ncbi:MAG: phenylalanine--tRNA ligase subunit beta [Nitrospirota bacterium]
MPTIDIKKKDLEKLVGKKLTISRLEDSLTLAKAELKEYNTGTDELKVELSDSNRPDLWSVEGIARQIRGHLAGKPASYPFFATKKKPVRKIKVSRDMKEVRPYIAACAALGLRMNEESLVQMIQSQDKLSDIFGRKRRMVSIGIYELDRIVFPVDYRLAEPEEVSFTPLGMDERMNLKEILERHPKGITYGPVVGAFKKYPVLIDSHRQVLSFPPIINSRETGEVKTGTKNILVEVTGTDLRMVLLAINILSVNLYDRGAGIEHVLISYPYSTDLGNKIITPHSMLEPVKISIKEITKTLGEDMPPREIRKHLESYGHKVSIRKDSLFVHYPPYRDDIMHPVDTIEDVAISKGYGSFKPEMPQRSTLGGLSRIELFSDLIRDFMVGSGFQEIVSNVLGSSEELIEWMGVDEKLIEIENIMSRSYSVVRNRILPFLLKVEASSSKAFYPHRIFEIGEVGVYDPSENLGSKTGLNLGSLISHSEVSFSEIHSYLDLLFYYTGFSYRLEPAEHPIFMSGRCGNIIVEGRPLGLIGEISPVILDRWQISMPCSAFEINLDSLIL